MKLFGKHNFKPLSANEKRVLERLAGKDKSGIIKDNCLIFKKYELEVELIDCMITGIDGNFTAYLLFKIGRKDFDEPIIEPSTAIGDSAEKAMDMASDQFASVMLSVMMTLSCEDMSNMENSFDGSKHIYQYPCSLPVICLGNTKSRERTPFEIVKKELPDYLGARKYTWVKLFVGRTGEKTECEARINGIIVPELSKMLDTYVQEDEDKDQILMEKQCILFVQSKRTFRSLRHRPEEVKSIASWAISIIVNIHDDKSWSEGAKKITSATHDPLLTQELLNFIPEIVALNYFSFIKHTSDITLNLDDKEELNLKKHQLTAWCACEKAVEDMLLSGERDTDYINSIMHYCSSCYNLVCDLLNKYTDEQLKSGDLRFSGLNCPFPMKYKHKIY
ncbi:MAG: hypothetical protein J6I46_08445 [Ruminococcus sp.]|nr:hypothetical protein [Ruminococcus sp.]